MFKLQLKQSETLHTPFGVAKMSNDGYYRISSGEKENVGKLFHRLLYEKFYGEIPPHYIIHHSNGNCKDNCLMNLKLLSLSDHISLHKKGNDIWLGRHHSSETKEKMSKQRCGELHPMYGKRHSQESKFKMSKSKNTTGYYRVSKGKKKDVKQGFTWRYKYYDETGKAKVISKVNLDDLKLEVERNGLEWREI